MTISCLPCQEGICEIIGLVLSALQKPIQIKTYVQLLCFLLLISLCLQCTVVLLEDKMTKRHKFTIKERKTGDKLTGVRERE